MLLPLAPATGLTAGFGVALDDGEALAVSDGDGVGDGDGLAEAWGRAGASSADLTASPDFFFFLLLVVVEALGAPDGTTFVVGVALGAGVAVPVE
jgi:hypothetical protein